MSLQAQAAKARAFHTLHDRSSLLLLANAWDAGSARLLAGIGFRGIATTSGGVAWALGYPDGERAPLTEVVQVIGRMVRAVSVPVTADIEAGYGQTPAEVGQTVRAVIDAGAVGINLEDGMHAPNRLRDLSDATARIRAARGVAEAAGIPIVINARVDTYMVKFGAGDDERFEETVRRAKAYLAAGADCVFPIGLADGSRLGALVAAIEAPVNVAARPGLPPLVELQRLGIARVSTATRLATVAWSAVERAAQALRESGRFDCLEATLSHGDMQQLMEG